VSFFFGQKKKLVSYFPSFRVQILQYSFCLLGAFLLSLVQSSGSNNCTVSIFLRANSEGRVLAKFVWQLDPFSIEGINRVFRVTSLLQKKTSPEIRFAAGQLMPPQQLKSTF
jgi:hypothetical protein